MNDLQKLAVKFGSDKHGHHNYCEHYHAHFKDIRFNKMKILELGIGGYEYPERGGAGLRMWSEYFNRSEIFGIDLFDKNKVSLPVRTKIFQGSQADGDFLLQVMSQVGEPEIIIDDASHINALTIQSFKHLFPWLKSGGYYVIEDIESSWWVDEPFDGTQDFEDLNFPSSINFCRQLINLANTKHLPTKQFENWYKIESLHFYENLVMIKKK